MCLLLYKTKDFILDVYIDAYFAGMWHWEYSSLHEKGTILLWVKKPTAVALVSKL
jgi:hypothetical protein